MFIEQAIKRELLAAAGVTDLVGQRVYYPSEAPQDVVKPYVVSTKISAPRQHSHSGSSHLVEARFQFSIFADTYYEVKQIAAAIQAALQGFSGMMGGVGGVYVNGCFYEDETDLGDEGIGLAVDYKLWHRE